jgi:hypothetical protein
MTIENAVEELLNAFEKIQSEHGEVHDTAVREILRQHMDKGLREPVDLYDPGMDFAMYSDEGDTLVRDALMEFLNHPAIAAIRLGQDTSDKVLAVCRELDVVPYSDREDILILLALCD